MCPTWAIWTGTEPPKGLTVPDAGEVVPSAWPAKAMTAAAAAAAIPMTVPTMPRPSDPSDLGTILDPDRPHYPFCALRRKNVGTGSLPHMG